MLRRVWSLLPLVCLLVGPLLSGGVLYGQGPKPKDPTWVSGLELRVRKAGEEKFTDATPKYSIEIFRDENSGDLVYVCQTGACAVTPAGTVAVGAKPKEPSWLTGLELKVRKAGEDKFTDATKKYGLEIFKDENTGNLVYVCETGALAVIPGTLAAGTKGKEPTWLHGLELLVRKDEPNFTKDTKKIGLEVFRDENTGNLIYISETGSIAVQPPRPNTTPEKALQPTWLYGLVLKPSKGGETDPNKGMAYGLEVFKDDATGQVIYIADTGALNVASVEAAPLSTKAKKPAWQYTLDLKVRKVGEDKFSDATKKYAVDVFKDENINVLAYVSEVGSLGVTPAK